MARHNFKLVSWNERNNPDLPREQVRHDAAIALKTGAGIVSLQEIGERSDLLDFQKYFPKTHWHWITPNEATPIVVRKSRFDVLETHYHLAHGGLKSISPHRGTSEVILQPKWNKKLEPFYVLGNHFVSAAWSQRKVAQREWRKKHWNIHWGMLRGLAREHQLDGLSGFALGDFNRITLPKLLSRSYQVSHHGLDHILWIPAVGGLQAHVIKAGQVKTPVHTDHIPIYVNVRAA